MRTVSLDQIRVESPCAESWEEMDGDGRMRFCSGCRKHVHHLEKYKRSEAERLVADGDVCVRFARDGRGRVITRELAWRERIREVVTRWVPGALLGVVAMFGVGCTREVVVVGMPGPKESATQPATRPSEKVLMDDVCVPPPAGGEIQGGIAPPTKEPATQPTTFRGKVSVH